MTTLYLPDAQTATVIADAGTEWRGWACVRILQAVFSENGGDAWSLYHNNDQWRSWDVGLFALNTHWIPEPSWEDRLTPGIAAGYAYRYYQRWWSVLTPTYPSWADRRDAVIHKMWHGADTPRYMASFDRAVAAAKAIGQVP
jgi:hypothetical protein